jgi:hypothetical protein
MLAEHPLTFFRGAEGEPPGRVRRMFRAPAVVLRGARSGSLECPEEDRVRGAGEGDASYRCPARLALSRDASFEILCQIARTIHESGGGRSRSSLGDPVRVVAGEGGGCRGWRIVFRAGPRRHLWLVEGMAFRAIRVGREADHGENGMDGGCGREGGGTGGGGRDARLDRGGRKEPRRHAVHRGSRFSSPRRAVGNRQRQRTVTIFGPTSVDWTAPRGLSVRIVRGEIECAPCFKRQCPHGAPECLTRVDSDAVYAAAVSLIEEGSR